MKYRVVIDSCGDLTEELKNDERFKTASLSIDIDGYNIIDDETFDQADFLRRVAESPNCPKSSCPSPDAFMELFDCGAQNVYVVTLSSQLSGSYNSAVLAKQLYLEEHENVNIHVVDSKSASIGETLLAYKIKECEEAGLEFEQVVEEVEKYRDEQNTYFVLESLEALRKNGRLSNLKAFVVNKLNIKPVMGSTDEGAICQLGQGRGINKALDKMIYIAVSKAKNPKNMTIAVSHCNCKKRGEYVKNELIRKGGFKEVFLVDTAGISSLYASDGGIILAV